jgi:hypothetical protein
VVCGDWFDKTAIDGAFCVDEIAGEAIAKVSGSVLDDGEGEVVDVWEPLVWIEMKCTKYCGFEILGYFRPEDMEQLPWMIACRSSSPSRSSKGDCPASRR